MRHTTPADHRRRFFRARPGDGARIIRFGAGLPPARAERTVARRHASGRPPSAAEVFVTINGFDRRRAGRIERAAEFGRPADILLCHLRIARGAVVRQGPTPPPADAAPAVRAVATTCAASPAPRVFPGPFAEQESARRSDAKSVSGRDDRGPTGPARPSCAGSSDCLSSPHAQPPRHGSPPSTHAGHVRFHATRWSLNGTRVQGALRSWKTNWPG